MHSEERDRLWDSLYNLILMDYVSPASTSFYNSINANDLLGITLLQSTVTNLGDTVNPGTPYSPEEMTYETTLRVQCVGQAYETKFNDIVPGISAITASGILVINGSVYT